MSTPVRLSAAQAHEESVRMEDERPCPSISENLFLLLEPGPQMVQLTIKL
jgi:hypothetical protein